MTETTATGPVEQLTATAKELGTAALDAADKAVEAGAGLAEKAAAQLPFAADFLTAQTATAVRLTKSYTEVARSLLT